MPLTRRTLVMTAASCVAWQAQAALSDQQIIALWPEHAPGGGGPSGPVQIDEKGAVHNIAVPTLEVFVPEKPNGAAMLVAAGGGYKRIKIGNEARPAARWLATRGITAFVLSYRLPQENWHEGPLAPLQDAQRALRLIRSKAGQYGLSPDRVGALGFSAGGHLMGLAATRSAYRSYEPIDETDKLSARPAEAALIYPVITLEPPYDHTSTRVQLVGHHAEPAQVRDWSVETHVRSRCPPTFLAQAQDDPISNIANSRIMADACEHAGVPVELHVTTTGGHGFAMGRSGTASMEWPRWYAEWLKARGTLL